MSKRGSSQARSALHMAAVNSVIASKKRPASNPVLSAFYEEKRKSKPGKVAMCAVMRKISNIIFDVLRNPKPFELRQPQEHASKLECVLLPEWHTGFKSSRFCGSCCYALTLLPAFAHFLTIYA